MSFVSLALIGIPQTSGFISKWYLCVGSLEEAVSVYSYLGPAILLVSALLTAGYLLPITINGFLPGKDFKDEECPGKEPKLIMLIPIIILTAVSVLIGLFPEVLTWV